MIIFTCILVVAFFVFSEYSLVRSRKTRFDNNTLVSKYVNDMFEKMDDYLSTCQLGITGASLILGKIGEEEFIHLLELLNIQTTISLTTIALCFVLFLEIIFGELIPKSISIRTPEKTLTIIAIPLYYINKIFKIFTTIMYFIAKIFLKLFGIKNELPLESYSINEMIDIVETNLHDNATREIIGNAFDFNDKIVKDIMSPRNGIVGIDINEAKESSEYVHDKLKQGYTRIPVYSGSLDNIIGIVNVKKCIDKIIDNTEINLHKILSNKDGRPFFVPETLKIKNLLNEMRSKQVHIAIVKDEFGSTSGIITMEDIMEVLIGEIYDENDDIIELITKIDDYYIVNSDAKIDDLQEYLPRIPDVYGCSTVSGLINYIFEKIPEEDEIKDFCGYKFTILNASKTKCELIRIDELE